MPQLIVFGTGLLGHPVLASTWKKDSSTCIGSASVPINFGCISMTPVQTSLHISHHRTMLCVLCLDAIAASRIVAFVNINSQATSRTSVRGMLDFWLTVVLNEKKEHPACKVISFRHECLVHLHTLSLDFRCTSLMLRPHELLFLPRQCMVLRKTLCLGDIRTASSSDCTTSL